MRCFVVCLLLLAGVSLGRASDAAKPNIILIMADDLGWGDTGYNGNPVIKTPHLDAMAKDGLRMDRFYSASAVCSPTRASCLTGRSPYRTGVFFANRGILRPEEVTLPEILRQQGYVSGHFGKWHLGTLTATEVDANRGRPGQTTLLNPPKEHGYDECLVTESKVPTYDPMKVPLAFPDGGNRHLGWPYLKPSQECKHYGTYYWDIRGKKVTDNLDGDDSRIIMDRVLPFIDKAVKKKKPFLSVVWFHAPHLPCVAGPKYQEMYKDYPLERRNYAGCITAMDEQIGRLRAHLANLGVERNTMIWFCSDNGPEGKENGKNGSAGEFRGRKRDLYEGGVRVPGLLVWPAKVQGGQVTDVPCATYDYVPTILDALNIEHPKPAYAMDGVSLIPLIEGRTQSRSKLIGQMISKKLVMNGEKYKLISTDGGKTLQLYDMVLDCREQHNIATQHPEVVNSLKSKYDAWQESVRKSFEGEEYGRTSCNRLDQKWSPPTASITKTRRSKKGERRKGQKSRKQ